MERSLPVQVDGLGTQSSKLGDDVLVRAIGTARARTVHLANCFSG